MSFTAQYPKIGLSKREKEILNYSAEGYSAKKIAKITGLTPGTIQAYSIAIRKKLNARNMTHAVSLAYKLALI